MRLWQHVSLNETVALKTSGGHVQTVRRHGRAVVGAHTTWIATCGSLLQTKLVAKHPRGIEDCDVISVSQD